jgi:acetylornithine deacetylase/succinyl-diaminopimelate desuccinylase-like protein
LGGLRTGEAPERRSDRIARLVDDRFDAYLERIRALCRMPSVSATGEGVRAVADAIAEMVREAGGRVDRAETPGNPVLLAEFPGPEGASTVLRYGMYDVQPAEEPDWSAPPFGAEIVDLPEVGPAVVCRGVANSKGSLVGFLCALEILRDTGGLPVTVKMVVEGEEELGSPNLPEVVRSRAGELAADAGLDLDLCGHRDGTADVYTGCKGLLSLELECRAGDWGGPRRPLHSSEAAWISSPVWHLVHALASILGPDEELRVSGINDAVVSPTEDDRRVLKELAETFDPEGHLAEAGASRFRLEGTASELLEALIFRPTANIDGLEAGYTGPGGKTIVPDRARAVLDVRLVPDLDPDAAFAAIRAHLGREGFGHVDARQLESYPWAKSEPDTPISRAIRVSYERMGRRANPYPMVPWCAPFYVFDRILGIPWASGGLGHSGGSHGPDEFASVQGLRDHIVGTAETLLAFAEEAA